MGAEAFEEARRRDVPVLLSVGYAACHWCHVMAHESFEDEATAAYLNEHFVSIKVDREERPDVDAVYMEATVAMTGHGGWPMTWCSTTTAARSSPAPTSPTSRGAGSPLPPGARRRGRRLGATAPTTYDGWPASCASTSAGAPKIAASVTTTRMTRPHTASLSLA